MRALAACACAAVLAAGPVACGDDSTDDGRPHGPGAAAAIAAAEADAAERGIELKAGTQFLRSTRDPRWALVSGARAGRGI